MALQYLYTASHIPMNARPGWVARQACNWRALSVYHRPLQAAAATDEAGVSRPHELATVDLADRRRAIQAAVRFVETLMAEDRKSTGLKALQVSDADSLSCCLSAGLYCPCRNAARLRTSGDLSMDAYSDLLV